MLGFREMKRAILILVIGLFWCSVGFAGCIEGNCIDGQGTYTRSNGNKWVGTWKDSEKYYGQYIYIRADGSLDVRDPAHGAAYWPQWLIDAENQSIFGKAADAIVDTYDSTVDAVFGKSETDKRIKELEKEVRSLKMQQQSSYQDLFSDDAERIQELEDQISACAMGIEPSCIP